MYRKSRATKNSVPCCLATSGVTDGAGKVLFQFCCQPAHGGGLSDGSSTQEAKDSGELQAACQTWRQICSVRLSYHSGKKAERFTFTPTREPRRRKGKLGSAISGHCAGLQRQQRDADSPKWEVFFNLSGTEMALFIAHTLSHLTGDQRLTPEPKASFCVLVVRTGGPWCHSKAAVEE